MANPAKGVYRGVSAEQRHAERRRLLMDAALQLLGTEGWSATTVRGVCQGARLTPRFFYESFEDIDALAVAVYDELMESAITHAFEAFAAAGETPRDKADAVIGTFVRELTDDPRKARVVFVEAVGCEPLMERRRATMASFVKLGAAQARAFYRASGNDDPFVEMTAAVLSGGLGELLIIWLDGSLKMTREQLIEDFVTLFVVTGESAAAIATDRARAR